MSQGSNIFSPTSLKTTSFFLGGGPYDTQLTGQDWLGNPPTGPMLLRKLEQAVQKAFAVGNITECFHVAAG